jgi:hypothetical protein
MMPPRVLQGFGHVTLPIRETLQLSMQVVGEESHANEFILHGIIAYLGDPEQGHYIYLSR